MLDMRKTVYAGGPAYNGDVVTLDGVTRRLLDFQQGCRPLVVVFGSCTWPPFMAAIDTICQMAGDNADVVDFVIVYIEEAHPSDGWAFSENYDINQHRTISDRLAAAATLVVCQLPANTTVVTDSMSDERSLNRAYGGLYERLYVIHQGTVVYQGLRGPAGFRPGEVASWLKAYRDTQNVYR